MKGKKDTIGFVKKNIILLIVVLAGILLLAFQHITPNWEQLPSREPTGF